MPGSPNNKVIVGLTANREVTMVVSANMKAALRTQAGLEHIQRIIEDKTSPPVLCSLASIDAYIAALP